MALFTPLFLFLLVHEARGAYTLRECYSPANDFMSKFDFWNAPDPTSGHVQYLSEEQSKNAGLVQERIVDGHKVVRLGVDYTNITPQGRSSVRLHSKTAYNHGLAKTGPTAAKSTFTKGLHLNTRNGMVLHTGPNCAISQQSHFEGTLETSNCDVKAPNQSPNEGCRINAHNPEAFGDGLNGIGGSVYATLWTKSSIKIWFFPRGQIPADIESGDSPNPESWTAAPAAVFEGPCEFDKTFKDLKIIINLTFCGEWAGAVWGSVGECAQLAPDCNTYVSNNPEAFRESYWDVRYVKTYSLGW
ncbi:hypothetical protein AJ79_10261 [Helicocarpus griseus UAMH5409]|uniref:GH16 domain-containing protein n=1 Tax=Helicocarpus griseus UAMH5409 TaxID=1447875 RepID=A0A2B7WEU3_9EURO|nr:hypothetical protein AJ79_10261 [Helicocarpus griseus UAMH5409]